MNEMLAKFPEELLIAFGMNNMDYSTILGYISFYFLIHSTLFGNPGWKLWIWTGFD